MFCYWSSVLSRSLHRVGESGQNEEANMRNSIASGLRYDEDEQEKMCFNSFEMNHGHGC